MLYEPLRHLEFHHEAIVQIHRLASPDLLKGDGECQWRHALEGLQRLRCEAALCRFEALHNILDRVQLEKRMKLLNIGHRIFESGGITVLVDDRNDLLISVGHIDLGELCSQAVELIRAHVVSSDTPGAQLSPSEPVACHG